MFTGIIQEIGTVAAVADRGSDRTLTIAQGAVASRLFLGASIAIDGVCQTVTEIAGDRFVVAAMTETLRVTSLGELEIGQQVNLETPIAAGAPMGGHFVQGHVDAVGRLQARTPVGEAERFTFDVPEPIVAELVPKGSVAVDGISLTVGPQLGTNQFEVYLIPHTLEVTTLGAKRPGDAVNLETDILAKYVLKAIGARGGPEVPGRSGQSVSWDKLAETGFTASATPSAEPKER